MKTAKRWLPLLLAAALAILVWEGSRAFTPAHMYDRGLSTCKAAFAENQAALNEALPNLLAIAGTVNEPQALPSGLYAYAQGTPAAPCIAVPVKSVGDFYQNTYTFGLVWTADVDPLAEKNPGIILISLTDGWYAYAISAPQ